MTQELISAAKSVIESLDHMRKILPHYADEHLIAVAKAIEKGANGTPESKRTGPATLAQAIAVVLKEAGGQARNSEIFQALENKGWSHLTRGVKVRVTVNRTLRKDPRFVSLSRGLWGLSADAKIKKQALEARESATLEALKHLGGPTTAKKVADHLGLGLFQAVTCLKSLHEQEKVKIKEKQKNGTALWVVT